MGRRAVDYLLQAGRWFDGRYQLGMALEVQKRVASHPAATPAERRVAAVAAADLMRRLGMMQLAEAAANEAVKVAEAAGDLDCQRHALQCAGTIAFDRSDMRAALECYQTVERMARDHGRDDWLAQALGNVGIAYARMGRNAAAQSALEDAMWYAKDDGTRVRLKLNLAALTANRDGSAAGLRAMGSILEQARAFGDEALLTHVLNAQLGMQLGVDDAAAPATYRECVEVATRTGMRQIRAIADTNFTTFAFARGEHAEVERIATSAAAEFRELDDARTLSAALTIAAGARLLMHGADLATARLLRESARNARRAGEPHALSSCLLNRVKLAVSRDRLALARRIAGRMRELAAAFNLNAQSTPGAAAAGAERLISEVEQGAPRHNGLPPSAFDAVTRERVFGRDDQRAM